jgi:hypothetical protein
MPRKVVRRAWRGDMVRGLDPALAGYLLDGDFDAARADLKARGQGVLTLHVPDLLGALWRRHRVELEAEAERRGIRRPWWPANEGRA